MIDGGSRQFLFRDHSMPGENDFWLGYASKDQNSKRQLVEF